MINSFNLFVSETSANMNNHCIDISMDSSTTQLPLLTEPATPKRKFLIGVLADYLAELKRSFNKLYVLQEGVKYFNIDFKMNINDGTTLL